MKKLIVVFLSILIGAATLKAQQQERFVPTVLVEFYTSEGCSSCPQADVFATQIRNIADSNNLQVYTLDYHVDLWNQSGWIDPFSDSNYTSRQEMMALANEQRAMFTPMVFVNGKGALPAGAKNEVGKLIESFTKNPSSHYLLISATWTLETKTMLFNYDIKGKTDSLDICIALAQKEVESTPTSGENKNIRLTHHNVVRQFVSSNRLTAPIGSIPMLISNNDIDLRNCVAVCFLQHKRTKQIMATQVLDFSRQ